MRVKEIVKVTQGELIAGDRNKDIDLSKVSTDSRSINKGDLFIALSGPNFSGSDFAQDAFRKGAIGVLAERYERPEKSGKRIVIKVKDATKALQDIARAHRRAFDIPVIAVTGSNGKTTVKEMIASVLSARYNVLKNEGTKNNHIGVPQTLLRLTKAHEVCVLELGTNHKGEIAALSGIARPTGAVMTNIGPSHLEFLSDLDGVFEEKKDLLRSLDTKRAIAVLNGDDEYLSNIEDKGLTIIRYGLGEYNDVSAKVLSSEVGRMRFLFNGREEFELKALGVHNVYNALAAIAVGYAFGLGAKTIRKALAGYRPEAMRLDPLRVNGIDIINDAYNSNPLSMKTALDAIQSYPARARWVVAGDMLELGESAEHFHRAAGELIAESGIAGLVTFGALSKHMLSRAGERGMDRHNLWHCSSHDEIVDILKRVTRQGDLVLVKGSRGMKLEKVIEKFKGPGARGQGPG